MNISESFDCERFLSLGGSELVAYAEPFVNTRMVNAPESAYDILAPRLGRLDEEHTVYALEICMAIKPSEFVSVVIGFLSNTTPLYAAPPSASWNGGGRRTLLRRSWFGR